MLTPVLCHSNAATIDANSAKRSIECFFGAHKKKQKPHDCVARRVASCLLRGQKDLPGLRVGELCHASWRLAQPTAARQSPWEREWLDNIDAWRDVECERLNEKHHRDRALFAVRAAQLRNRLPRTNLPPTVQFKEEEVQSFTRW